MKKKINVILWSFLLYLMLGCNATPEVANPAENEVIEIQEDIENTVEGADVEEAAEPDYEVTYPITVMDQVGRQVTIEEEPQTIVSGYYISTSLLIALGQEDKIIGVENNPEKRPVYEMSVPHLLELSQVGTVKELDLERCAILQPDLLVLPFKLKDTADSLEQLGIPVIYVKPESQELLTEAIALLGMVTNSNQRAVYLQSMMYEKTKDMQQLVDNWNR